MKRLVSCLMCLALAAGLMPLPAYAQDVRAASSVVLIAQEAGDSAAVEAAFERAEAHVSERGFN